MKLLQIGILFIGLISWEIKAQPLAKEAINWIPFEQLSDSLERNPKPVFLFFHTEWCSYCKKMQRETFKDPKVIQKLNEHYYAVEMDAESLDSIYFDGVLYTNPQTVKKTGQYHQLFRLLMQDSKKPTFPTSLFLDRDFKVTQRKFNYISIKQMLNIL